MRRMPKRPRTETPRQIVEEFDDCSTPKFGEHKSSLLQVNSRTEPQNSLHHTTIIAAQKIGNLFQTKSLESRETDGYYENCAPMKENKTPSDVRLAMRIGESDMMRPITAVVETIDEDSGKPGFASLPNMASAQFGAVILFASDEFFGLAENLLSTNSPVKGLQGPYGNIVDAWETRRRRAAGHDWVIIELPESSFIRGFEVDMRNVINKAPRISIEGGWFQDLTTATKSHLKSQNIEMVHKDGGLGLVSTHIPSKPYEETVVDTLYEYFDSKSWTELLPCATLAINEDTHYFALALNQKLTHLRLNLFPDGGIARFKAFGEPHLAPGLLKLIVDEAPGKILDMLQPHRGGWVLWASHGRGSNLSNLISPLPPLSRENGWCLPASPLREHAVFRNSEHTGQEVQIVFKLAARCRPKRVEIDTKWFIGDCPRLISVECLDSIDISELPLIRQIQFFKAIQDMSSLDWRQLVPAFAVQPNTLHCFALAHDSVTQKPQIQRIDDLYSTYVQKISLSEEYITHLRIKLSPDGGLSRIRLIGSVGDQLVSESYFEPALGDIKTHQKKKSISSNLYHSLGGNPTAEEAVMH